jgi:Mrp family chromosome partitioning ATPase
VATEFADKRVNGFAPARIMSESPEVADAYDALFGALRLAPPLASGNVLLVTSAEPGEGKTTVASCLATTASLAGQTVLLIDGDLRRSSLTAAVGRGDTAGLIEILLGEAEPAEAIHPITALTDSPQAGVVSFMARGRKSPRFLGAVDWSKARTTFYFWTRPRSWQRMMHCSSPPSLMRSS